MGKIQEANRVQSSSMDGIDHHHNRFLSDKSIVFLSLFGPEFTCGTFPDAQSDALFVIESTLTSRFQFTVESAIDLSHFAREVRTKAMRGLTSIAPFDATSRKFRTIASINRIDTQPSNAGELNLGNVLVVAQTSTRHLITSKKIAIGVGIVTIIIVLALGADGFLIIDLKMESFIRRRQIDQFLIAIVGFTRA
jgi:hypothetical protein